MKLRSVLDQYDFADVEEWPSCALEGTLCGCAGALDFHHVIAKQRLKRYVKPVGGQQVRAIRDRRNLVPLCRVHHDLVESARLRIEEVPEGFWDYVADYGLRGALPRHLTEAA